MAGDSVLSSIGKALLGPDLDTIQAQANEAATQLQVALSTMIALQAITAAAVFLVAVIAWKERH